MVSDEVWLCDRLGTWSTAVPSGLEMEWDDCVLFARDCKLDGSQPKLYVSSSSGLGNLMGDLCFFGRLGMSTVSVDCVPDPVDVAGVPMSAIGLVLLICRLLVTWRRSRYWILFEYSSVRIL